MQRFRDSAMKTRFLQLIVILAITVTGSFTFVTVQTAHATQTEAKGYIQQPAHLSIQELRPFVGQWNAHFASLEVKSDGTAAFSARTYAFCGPEVPQPCDRIEGNTIYPGIQETIAINSVKDQIAYGTIITGNKHPEGTKITLTLQPENTLQFNETLLCGPEAPAGYCGA